MDIKIRLTILNFLEFAIWGAYLTSMSRYLITAGLGDHISYFYSVQGFVSLFMPALMGIVADRWIQAQKTLSFCQLMAGAAMIAAALYGQSAGANVSFSILFTIYTISIAFYMPTVALTSSVAYTALEGAGLDTVKAFPPIRVFGTIGFIISMLFVDWSGLQDKPWQFAVSGFLGIIMALYALTMPACPTNKGGQKGLAEALGLRAFALFKQRKMAVFFIFSMLLGSALQITNGYANPFIASFGADEAFAETFAVQHANTLISLSQASETLCILLIPFFLKRFGIKVVMLISMFAWVLRFGFFAVGDPGFPGLILLILSMIVYGIAFDFFNISGSLFVDQETDLNIRSSAQGLFMMMTNGIGASIGMLLAGRIVSHYTYGEVVGGRFYTLGDWSTCWWIFSSYALVIAILFALLFRYRHEPGD